jgi:hypothetical protein
VGGQTVAGPSGSSTLVGVNILPGDTQTTGTVATVGLLNGDGTVVQVALPTTGEAVQQGLAPVGALTGVLLGEQVGGTVTQITNGLAPTVATVTSTVDQVTTPLLGAVNGLLAPVTAPLVGENGVLAPVVGVVGTLVGGLPGSGGGTAVSGPLIGADVGGNVLTGASTTNTVVGVNILTPDAGSAQGQLLTAEVLTPGTIVDVALPTTAGAVEAGLAPVGNLTGALLGPQVGGAVDQVVSGIAPVVATVTSTVDSVVSPVLDAVNGLAPALPAGGGTDGGGTGGGSLLAPVTDLLAPVTGLLGGLTTPAGGGGSGTAPSTGGLLGGLLGQ